MQLWAKWSRTARSHGNSYRQWEAGDRAVLTFVPVAGGSPSYGATDREGKYRLAFTDTKFGAMVGEHEVEIATNKISASERAEMKAQGMEVPEQQVTIPKKYREKGALKATVERKANVIDFP